MIGKQVANSIEVLLENKIVKIFFIFFHLIQGVLVRRELAISFVKSTKKIEIPPQ